MNTRYILFISTGLMCMSIHPMEKKTIKKIIPVIEKKKKNSQIIKKKVEVPEELKIAGKQIARELNDINEQFKKLLQLAEIQRKCPNNQNNNDSSNHGNIDFYNKENTSFEPGETWNNQHKTYTGDTDSDNEYGYLKEIKK